MIALSEAIQELKLENEVQSRLLDIAEDSSLERGFIHKVRDKIASSSPKGAWRGRRTHALHGLALAAPLSSFSEDTKQRIHKIARSWFNTTTVRAEALLALALSRQDDALTTVENTSTRFNSRLKEKKDIALEGGRLLQGEEIQTGRVDEEGLKLIVLLAQGGPAHGMVVGDWGIA